MRIALSAALLLIALPLVAAEEKNADVIDCDRPGIANGSGTVGREVFQIEVGFERDHQAGATLWSTPVLFRYGLTKAFELRVQGNGYERLHVDGFRFDGWSPVGIGFKYHIFDEDEKTHRPSLGLIGNVTVPSGSSVFKSHRTGADLTLAADFNLTDHWQLEANGGASLKTDDHSFFAGTAAMTIQYNIDKTRNVFIDGGLTAPEEKGGTSAVLVDTGAAWIVASDTQFDVSIGWGAHGSSVPDTFIAAGVSHRF